MTIIELQQALNKLGAKPPLESDGKFGNATTTAVKAFQKKNGLDDDGKVGPATQGKIQELLSKLISTAKIPVLSNIVQDTYRIRDYNISYPRIQQLHPKIRIQVYNTIAWLEKNAFNPRIQIRIVQGLRTFAEQNALYAQGRTVKGSIVTNAKGGQSVHNYGLAFDFAIMYDLDGNGTYETLSWDTKKDYDGDGIADWLEVVNAFKVQGFNWGGEWQFKDDPHLEKTFQFNGKYSPMLVLYNAGKKDKEGYIIF